MAKFHSPTKGFVSDDLHPIPADAVPISEEQWQVLVVGVNQLRLAIEHVDGVPTLVDRPPPALADARRIAVGRLREACTEAIVAGFECDALGEVRVYPFSDDDQRNLLLAASAASTAADPGWSAPLWSRDGSGKWDFARHSVHQVHAVVTAGQLAVANHQTRLAMLTAAVAGADSLAAIAALAW